MSLADATGWPADEIAVLASGLGLDATALRSFHTYERLREAMAWMRRWRIDAATLTVWSDPTTPSAVLAETLRSAASSRHPTDGPWRQALTSINDTLRENKRDALLAYLIEDDSSLAAPADVYAHYLIDVEMSSCMLTFRIKQANASIQLFVQRVLMNLEGQARLADGDGGYWRRWEWIKRYRVQESDRKVLLYAENYALSDVRTDKTPFFRELENELLQDEVTEATVERAYRGYLQRLEDVARLDPVGFYYQHEGGVLHVFGRTHTEPATYYYRRRFTDTGTWTAWEKVELTIQADHLLPVVHGRKLFLFWAAFEDRQEPEEPDRTALELSWSEYRDGVWVPAMTQPVKDLYLMGDDEFDRHRVFLRSAEHDGKLRIHIYHSWEFPAPHSWGGVLAGLLSVRRLRADPALGTVPGVGSPGHPASEDTSLRLASRRTSQRVLYRYRFRSRSLLYRFRSRALLLWRSPVLRGRSRHGAA